MELSVPRWVAAVFVATVYIVLPVVGMIFTNAPLSGCAEFAGWAITTVAAFYLVNTGIRYLKVIKDA